MYGSELGQVTAIRREFSLAELVALVPALPEPAAPVVRCIGRSEGSAKWIKERAEGAEYGHIEIAISEAEEFSIVLAHDWPAEVGADDVADLDRALTKGLVEGFAASFWLPSLGCRVHTIRVGHKAGTTPTVMELVARLAVHHLLTKATWRLGQAQSPEVA